MGSLTNFIPQRTKILGCIIPLVFVFTKPVEVFDLSVEEKTTKDSRCG